MSGHKSYSTRFTVQYIFNDDIIMTLANKGQRRTVILLLKIGLPFQIVVICYCNSVYCTIRQVVLLTSLIGLRQVVDPICCPIVCNITRIKSTGLVSLFLFTRIG